MLYSGMQIQLNFIPVGHTHADVDQLFSTISEELGKSGSQTIPGYLFVNA